jgi:hypothetical protein
LTLIRAYIYSAVSFVKAVIAHRRSHAMRNTLPAFPNPAQ